MKPERKNSTLPSGPIRLLALALGLSWVLSPACPGQTADALMPSENRGENAAEEKAAPAPDPVDATPSRFAGKDTESYISARKAAFSMQSRETDPFGLYQDPNAKPLVKSAADRLPVKRQTALPPTPLAEIVKLIRVTTIMPGEKKFLVGIREFSESDEFPLVYQGKRMRMKVTEVSAQRIVFTNLDNGESAPLSTGMLPPGMIAGAESVKPAGMVSPIDQLPLELGIPNSEIPNN
jgi:hypothetical protein